MFIITRELMKGKTKAQRIAIYRAKAKECLAAGSAKTARFWTKFAKQLENQKD